MVLRVLTILLVLLAGGLLYVSRVYTALPVDPAWQVNGDQDLPPGAVTVRFSGTSTLLFSDGETHWMVDGWFSRYGPLRLLLGSIGPDGDAIDRGLAANAITTLDAVIPVHSHFDHAMDAPEVARRTGAMLYGSESTANIGRGAGLPETQIAVLEDKVPVQLGKFLITPLVWPHFEFPDPAMRARALEDPEIIEPLVPPVAAFDYRLGTPYALHVLHPRGSFLVIGSAGYKAGGLEGFPAERIFLGVGGLGSQTAQYREAYWRETVEASGADTVIPIHYDSLTGPVEGPFRGPVMLMAFLSSGLEQTGAFLREKAAQNPALIFKTLPRFDEVLLLP